MNNGNRSNKLVVQQTKLSANQSDRPGLPPPPVPDNHITDLQQIQQQMMRKFGSNGTNNANTDLNCDLPPPPSPPNFSINLTQKMTSLSINQKVDQSESSCFDMPLPPPPIDLQDSIHLPPPISPPELSNTNGNHHVQLPPPPPLPPLVESDTTSSTSSLSATNTSSNGTNHKPQNEETQSSRSFLDDINKKRFVLKPTNRDVDDKKSGGNPGRESIQPFVNDSNVAAIIDFVRKLRTHVGDSSGEEENSDWDE